MIAVSRVAIKGLKESVEKSFGMKRKSTAPSGRAI